MSEPVLYQVGDMVTWEEPRECDRAFIGKRRELHGDGPFRVREVRDLPPALQSSGHPQHIIVERDGAPLSKGGEPSKWSGFWFRKA